MQSYLTICLGFLLATFSVRAQIDNSYINNNITLNQKDSNSFGIAVSNFNYLRNTEYFNTTEVGQTLFGTQLQPTLWVQLNKNTKLSAGIFLNTPFGSNQINQTIPVLSLTHTDNIGSFTFGSINGATSHQIIEPLFNINTAIENRVEQGAQYVINKPKLFFDAWINWQNNMQYLGLNHERFTTGLHVAPISKNNKGITVSVPFQFLLNHKGGQNSLDPTAQYSILNWALGLKIKKEISATKSVLAEHYFCQTQSDIENTKTGQAHFFNVTYNVNKLSFMLNYFSGNNFNTPLGTYIYQSQSRVYHNVYLPKRELLFFRLFYNKSLANNLNLSCRLEPFYDINNKQLDYSYSVYLHFNLSAKLANLKP